jgi:hypothetical protein
MWVAAAGLRKRLAWTAKRMARQIMNQRIAGEFSLKFRLNQAIKAQRQQLAWRRFLRPPNFYPEQKKLWLMARWVWSVQKSLVNS